MTFAAGPLTRRCLLVSTALVLLHKFTNVAAMQDVAIVGGGLAGLSAAMAAFEKGANVTMVEGEPRVGGNSAKATSGMNGCLTSVQRAQSVHDSTDAFFNDTFKAGRQMNDEELVDVLVTQSADAVERLRSVGIDLSDLTILGGHSVKRTHRIPPKDGKPIPVGFTIVRGVQSRLEKLAAAESNRFRILSSTIVTDLLTDSDQNVIGIHVKNKQSNEDYVIQANSVVLATGGYSNDHSDDSLLKEYAPETLRYPTTNGPFAVGSGVKMARKIGAKLVDMDKVQIHPTGFVDPKSPKERTKFLAPEALRGSGAILLNENGRRFANELGARDYLTERIEAHCQLDAESGGRVAFMVLNDDAAQRFGAASFQFYWRAKNFFQKLNDSRELAEYMKVPPNVIMETLNAYNESASKGNDEFGKVVFPTLFDWQNSLYVAKVTPSVHYTMGGVAINSKTNVLRSDGTIIRGLYAAGEVTGGVHGANRLGGNSLIECVVFGYIAGMEGSENTYSESTQAFDCAPSVGSVLFALISLLLTMHIAFTQLIMQ